MWWYLLLGLVLVQLLIVAASRSSSTWGVTRKLGGGLNSHGHEPSVRGSRQAAARFLRHHRGTTGCALPAPTKMTCMIERQRGRGETERERATGTALRHLGSLGAARNAARSHVNRAIRVER
jgi:hypothetical protein